MVAYQHKSDPPSALEPHCEAGAPHSPGHDLDRPMSPRAAPVPPFLGAKPCNEQRIVDSFRNNEGKRDIVPPEIGFGVPQSNDVCVTNLNRAASDSPNDYVKFCIRSRTDEYGSMMSNHFLPSDENVIDELICKATRARAFADSEKHYFSPQSTADIFDVSAGHGGVLRTGVHDDEIRAAIQEDTDKTRAEKRTRVIFIDGLDQDPERLPFTSSLLEEVFNTYGITPRFADFLTRQHMPGRAIHYEPGTRNLSRHDTWYSAVIRSHAEYAGSSLNLSRLVVDWQRMCVWATYSTDGDATFLVLRCPQYIKEKFYDAFQGVPGLSLRNHPMLPHAFFAEHLVIHAYDFLQFFSEPLYTWENKVNQLHSAEDYTRRSKAFLALSRQIHQVATDYDILAETIDHIQRQSEWFNDWLMSTTDPGQSSLTHPMSDAQRVLVDVFDNLSKDVKLIGTYSNLYLERSKIGVSECFAMVTQRDAELNIQMASESTTIARASHQDNRSLRIIQILSMIFLPASLVSSIFGMGFFNTQSRADGSAQFTISGNWWWYLAISVPITVALWLYMVFHGYYTAYKLNKEMPKSRRSSKSSDLEAHREKRIGMIRS